MKDVINISYFNNEVGVMGHIFSSEEGEDLQVNGIFFSGTTHREPSFSRPL